jgi:hypothetical protein
VDDPRLKLGVSRLLVQVEGQTEERFVNEVLAHHLVRVGYNQVVTRRMGNARQSSKRCGIKSWAVARPDIVRHLCEDSGRIVTTLVDYYALPKCWPGRETSSSLDFSKKAQHIHSQMSEDVSQQLGQRFNPNRFVPYVVMHEFEGLLFSDCQVLAESMLRQDLQPELLSIREQFNSPEEINDSPQTAPSKRLIALHPRYDKVLFGVDACRAIGLDAIRRECTNFDNWLTTLEQRVQESK